MRLLPFLNWPQNAQVHGAHYERGQGKCIFVCSTTSLLIITQGCSKCHCRSHACLDKPCHLVTCVGCTLAEWICCVFVFLKKYCLRLVQCPALPCSVVARLWPVFLLFCCSVTVLPTAFQAMLCACFLFLSWLFLSEISDIYLMCISWNYYWFACLSCV